MRELPQNAESPTNGIPVIQGNPVIKGKPVINGNPVFAPKAHLPPLPQYVVVEFMKCPR